MVGAGWDGRERGGPGSLLLVGTDSEIRGLLASILITHGFDPGRLPKVLRARRSQLYADRKAARKKGLIGGRPGPTAADDDDVTWRDLDLEDEAA